MSAFRLITLAAATAVLAGCDEFRYQIRMHWTDDERVERQVRYSVEPRDGNKDKKVDLTCDWLRETYGPPGSSDEKSATFAGTFAGRLPTDARIADLANFGSVSSLSSPMGTVRRYQERAPGLQRPAQFVSHMQELIDTMIAAWIAHAEGLPELAANRDRLAAVEALLRGPIREDALDAVLLFWREIDDADRRTADKTGGDDPDGLLRTFSLFLEERGYLRSTDAGFWSSDELAASAWIGVLRKVNTELGEDEGAALPPPLARLLDPEEMTRSFNEGLCALGISEKEFQDLAQMSWGPPFGGDSLVMDLRFEDCPKPDMTNGQWDAETRTLSWSGRAAEPPRLPGFFHAEWRIPNEDWQRQRFGAVIVSDRLPEYNAWYATLAQPDRERWDAVLDGVQSADTAKGALERFVESLPAAAPQRMGESDPKAGATLLLDALDKQAAAKE